MLYRKILLSIIMSILLTVSCKNKITDYSSSYSGIVNTTTNTNFQVVYYGDKSKKIVVSDEELGKLWREAFANKKIYGNTAMTSITGWTDAGGNYYESKTYSGQKPRTTLRAFGLTTYQGRLTVCGIYYDESYGFGNRWRKIIVTPEFVEQAAYGGVFNGVNTNNLMPPADFVYDTGWVWYNFIFGVMEH